MGRLNDQKKEARKVVGIDSISGLPREEVISAYVVNEGIANCVNQIAAEMKLFWNVPRHRSLIISQKRAFI